MEIIRGEYFRVMISFAKSVKFLDLEIILIYGLFFPTHNLLIEMGDSESGVFDSSIPNGIVLVSNEKLESFETIPN